MVTGLLIAKIVDLNEADLDDPVSFFESDHLKEITLRHLLSHTSGLSAWKPLYLLVDEPDDVLAAIS